MFLRNDANVLNVKTQPGCSDSHIPVEAFITSCFLHDRHRLCGELTDVFMIKGSTAASDFT